MLLATMHHDFLPVVLRKLELNTKFAVAVVLEEFVVAACHHPEGIVFPGRRY